jgi:hypothetical protein
MQNHVRRISTITQTEFYSSFLNYISRLVAVIKDGNVVCMCYLLYRNEKSGSGNVYKQYLPTRASYIAAAIRQFMWKI